LLSCPRKQPADSPPPLQKWPKKIVPRDAQYSETYATIISDLFSRNPQTGGFMVAELP